MEGDPQGAEEYVSGKGEVTNPLHSRGYFFFSLFHRPLEMTRPQKGQ
jgi:hypothetical protein